MNVNIEEPLFSPNAEYTAESPLIKTSWEDKSICPKCCDCCKVAYFPVGDFYICGHWRTSFSKVTLVSLLFIASIVLFIYNLFFSQTSWLLNHKSVLLAAQIVPLFSFLCLMVAYFNTICKGPGYYPYNWSTTKREQYTWKEMMDGVAVYQEQIDWARNNERPLRCSLSINARRFVMRGDHFCAWTQSWIGLKNQKDFTLTSFWSFFYCLVYIISQIPAAVFGVKEMISTGREVFHIIMTTILFLAMIVSGYIGTFSFKQFFVAMRNLSNNETITERYNRKPRDYSKGSILANFEDICGSRWLMLLWLFPFFPCIHEKTTTWSEKYTGKTSNDILDQITPQSSSVLK